MILSASSREQSGVNRMIPVAFRLVIIGAARTRGSVNWQKMAIRLPLFEVVKPVSYTHLTLPTICSV